MQKAPESDINFAVFTVAGAVLDRWRSFLLVLLVAWTTVVAFKMLRGRSYEYSVVVAPSSPRGVPSANALSVAAAALGTPTLPGTQAPAFIATLAQTRMVMNATGLTKVPSDGRTVIEHVLERDLTSIPAYQVARTISKHVVVTTERTTGLITITARHTDSIVARTMAAATVNETQRAYRTGMRTHAIEQRESLNLRVENAAARLRQAERDLLEYNRTNRTTDAFATTAFVRLQRQREVEVALSVYQQVMIDRESVLAKELEQGPVVAVVDAIPTYATPVPRGTGVLLAMVTVVVLFGGMFLIGGRLMMRGLVANEDPDIVAFLHKLERVPVMGRIVKLNASSDPHHAASVSRTTHSDRVSSGAA